MLRIKVISIFRPLIFRQDSFISICNETAWTTRLSFIVSVVSNRATVYSCTPSCLRGLLPGNSQAVFFCLFYRLYTIHTKSTFTFTEDLIGAGVKMTGGVHGARISYFHEYFLLSPPSRELTQLKWLSSCPVLF
jgi:hypothetical protein